MEISQTEIGANLDYKDKCDELRAELVKKEKLLNEIFLENRELRIENEALKKGKESGTINTRKQIPASNPV
jgi:regulator of replication initiation timing